jgi:putative transposase
MGQSTVFSQVIKQIPRSEFESHVAAFDGDRGTRSVDCWTWFGALLFGQLTGHDSIRAIERIFAHKDSEAAKLGFGPVRRSTLADANRTRPLGVLENLYRYCLKRAQAVAPSKTGFRFHGDVFAMDSTTIELCLSLSPWAQFHHDKGACKLHTAIDIAGNLPQFAVITDGRTHDVRVARNQWRHYFHKGAVVVMDRGYVDYGWMNELNEAGVFFVTRTKTNCRYQILECREHDRTRGVRADQIIRLNSQRGGRYEGNLRRVSFRDPITGKWLVFLTNRFDLSAKTICDLYKARWKVELFFKTMKQNLRIKKFLGTSAHSVKAQILVALIAYLLVMLLKYSMKSDISIPDAMAVVGTLLLLKEPLSRLLGRLPRVTRHPCGSQLTLDL